MCIKLQEIKGKTKIKFYKNISNYYDNAKFRMDEGLLLDMLKVLVKFILKYYC